jgi:non-heme chloroperoxidase
MTRVLLQVIVFVMPLDASIVAGAGHADDPPAAATAGVAKFDPNWVDRSPHDNRFVTVDGVRLHYLDWGGEGPALLFLHGLGDTPHIFDEFAPAFRDRFHVLGLTRRGHGRSDKPETGYDTDTLVEDVRKFLDAMKLERVVLAGHSVAGDELTAFAAKYPGRVEKLVYLDAAVRRSAAREALEKVPRCLRPGAADVASYESFRAWLSKVGYWGEAWEGNVREMMVLDARGAITSQAMPAAVSRAIIQWSMAHDPDYAKVTAPALSFAALGWSDRADRYLKSLPEDERRRAYAFRDEIFLPCQRKEVEHFRATVRNGRVVEMPGTDHHCFIQHRDLVVREMRAFLARD